MPSSAQLRVWNTGGVTLQVRNLEVKKQDNAKLPVSAAAALAIAANGGRPYKQVFDGGGYAVYENLNALPRVFCADQPKSTPSHVEALRSIMSWQVNPSRDVLFESTDANPLAELNGQSLECGPVSISAFRAGDIKVDVSASHTGILVFSEAWDPRWHVYLNGIETRDYKADYFAQSVVLKPGTRPSSSAINPSATTLLSPGRRCLLYSGSLLRDAPAAGRFYTRCPSKQSIN